MVSEGGTGYEPPLGRREYQELRKAPEYPFPGAEAGQYKVGQGLSSPGFRDFCSGLQILAI